MIFSWFSRNRTARVAAQWWADLAKEDIETSTWSQPADKKHMLDCMLSFRTVLQKRIRQELGRTPNITLQVDGRPDALLCETLSYAGLPRAVLSAASHALMMIDHPVVRVQRGADQIITTLTA
jgi:hypothetical protein